MPIPLSQHPYAVQQLKAFVERELAADEVRAPPLLARAHQHAHAHRCQLFESLLEVAGNVDTRALAKAKLAERIAQHVASSFLQTGASVGTRAGAGSEGFDPASGLSEPTPQCRRTLNTWLAQCVFGPPA